MKPDEILTQWEEHHQPLTDSQRELFLARDEVAELADLPRGIVEMAIWHSPKLSRILREASRIARERDDEAARTIEALKRHSQATTSVNRTSPAPAVAFKIKYGCRACGREFVDRFGAGVRCRRCRSHENVHPVCRSCGRVGDTALLGWCRPCYEVSQVAFQAAGPGARGPEGVDTKNPDRRKSRWTAQSLDRPD